MADSGTLALANRLLQALNARRSQGSLASQAEDCAPLAETLGYYDLADYLRKLEDDELWRQRARAVRWAELEERLTRAAEELEDLAADAGDEEASQRRIALLRGQREGMLLALGYMRDLTPPSERP